MERIIKAQALRDSEMDQFMMGKKIMELNPNHKLVKQTIANKSNGHVELLYQTALLNSGYQLDNPKDFVSTLYDLLMDDDETNVQSEQTVEQLVEQTLEQTSESTEPVSSMEQVD
jgi:heat shock protein beta